MTLNLTLEQNWSYTYSTRLYATEVPSGIPGQYRLQAIPETVIPILFHSPIIAVNARSDSAREHWTWAGSIQRSFSAFGTGELGIIQSDRRRIWLHQSSLIRFPPETPDYRLTFHPPGHLLDVGLTFWQYTGDIPSTEQSLADILAAIEQLQPP
jgi:hypothetical protein